MANANELSFLLQSKIDQSQNQIKLLNDQIKILSGKLNALELKINIDANGLKNVAEQINTQLSNIGKSATSGVNVAKNATSGLIDEFKKVKTDAEGATVAIQKMQKIADGKGGTEKILSNYNPQGKLIDTTTTYDPQLSKNAKEAERLENSIRKAQQDIFAKAIKEQQKAEDALVNKRKKDVDDFNKKNINAIDMEIKKREEAGKLFSKQLKEQMELESKQNATLQKNAEIIANIQKKAQSEVNVVQKYGTSATHKNANSLLSQIMGVTGDTDADVKQVKNLSESLKELSREARATGKSSLSLGEKFKTAFEMYPIWLGATTVIMQMVHAVQDGIKYIYEMDTAMTELNKVVDLSASQMQDMKQSAIDMGKALGQSSVEIMKGMAEFGRITKNPTEIKELTRVATMASNVTSLTAQEASKAITSTMITFGIQAKDSMKILDSWNEIQNNFRTSAEDLAAAIGKVGSASKIANTDMQTLEGIITSIVSSTGISGDEAGTAVKSFMSRIFRTDESDPEELGKTAKAFKEIADVDFKNADNSLRSFGDIVGETAGKWKNLSQQDKLALAQSVGSTYHYSKFIALMENYQMALDATSKAYNSNGSAVQENEKYLNSLEGKMKILGTTIESVWSKFISSSSVGGIIDFATAIAGLVDKIGILNIAIITFVGYWAIFQKGMILAPLINGVSTAVYGLATSLGIAEGATIALSTALGYLAPIALVAGFLGLASAIDNSNKAMENAYTSFQKDMSTAKSNTDELNKLAEKYSELANKKEKTIEDSVELSNIAAILNNKYDALSSGVDIYTSAMDNNSSAIQTNIKWMKEQAKAQAQNFISLNEGRYKEAIAFLGKSQTVAGSTDMITPEENVKMLDSQIARGIDLFGINKAGRDDLINQIQTAQKLKTEFEIYKNQLQLPDSVVTPNSKINTSTDTGGSSSDKNTLLDAFYALFNHRVKMGELTKQQQIDELNNAYKLVKTEEERWRVQEEIYSLQQDIAEEQKKAEEDITAQKQKQADLAKEQLEKTRSLFQLQQDFLANANNKNALRLEGGVWRNVADESKLSDIKTKMSEMLLNNPNIDLNMLPSNLAVLDRTSQTINNSQGQVISINVDNINTNDPMEFLRMIQNLIKSGMGNTAFA